MTKPMGTKQLIWLGVALAMVFIGTGGYYLGARFYKTYSPAPSGTAQPPTPTPSSETVTRITDPGVTWLAKPEKLGDLGLLNTQNYPSDSTSYYKIADLVGGGQLISAQIQVMGLANYRFKKDSADTYYLIVKNSDYLPDNKQDLLNKEKYNKGLIKIDWNTSYDSLSPPQTLIFNGTELKIESIINNNMFYETLSAASSVAYKKLGATAYGDLYKREHPNNQYPKLKRIDYFVKLTDTSLIFYTVKKDFFADDRTLIATLNSDNQNFKLKYFGGGVSVYGCGSGPTDELYEDPGLLNSLIQIGTTISGDPLYTIVDTNNDILKAAYETYKIGREQGNNLLSYESFAAQKPVLIWKDPLGNYLIFINNDFVPLAECGKPVIYLYPEKTTAVSVKVGAEIRISEPAYNSGWQVIANPNGSILNQDGRIYDSLYWEGLGNGFYPDIRTGRVVSSKNIEAELWRDLTTLGLNKKESDDFLAFWLPKMPGTPYIRLTWLGTKEMNQLAPLSIWPIPDKIARVFLDFQGQNTPDTNLKPQKLTGFTRQGFTVVEWGGLLIHGK